LKSGWAPGLVLLAWAAAALAYDPPAPARGPLPTLVVLCDARLLPVAERAAEDLRARGLVAARLVADSTENIVQALARQSDAADAIVVEDKVAVTLAVRLGAAAESDLVTLASDRLVVAVRETANVDPIKALLQAGPGRVALPDPKRAPAGVHAEAALKKIGIYDRVSLRATYFASGREAVAALAADQADAAIAYGTDVAVVPGAKKMLALPARSYLPLLYFGLPLAASKERERAKAFLDYLASPALADAWLKGGFQPPPDDMP